MDELQEYHGPLPWTVAQTLDMPAVVISDTDPYEDSARPTNDVDTSLVPGADDRTNENPEEVLEPADNIKKPPTDPPGTIQESADDYPEEGTNNSASASALGELASGTEVPNPVQRRDVYATLPAGLEVIKDEGVTIVANRNHSEPALVDRALATYRENPSWPHAPLEQFAERTYHVDNEDDPTLFAKHTNYSYYPGVLASEGLTEFALSTDIKEILDSEPAQRTVQEAGFASVSFVEPLLTASPDGSNTRTTIYPWKEARPLETVAIEQRAEGGEWEDGRRVAADIADDLRVLFSEQGIHAKDLNTSQIRVDSDNNVRVTDAELYVKFDKPAATFAPDQVMHREGDGEWHEVANSPHENPNQPREVPTGPGTVVLARGADSGQGLELTTEKGAGRVVVLWNVITKEGAIINNVDAGQLGAALREVYERLPNLKGLGTIEHAVGNYDVVRHPVLVHGVSMTARKSVPVTGVVDVRLSAATGIVEVYSKSGERLYRYRPPTHQGEA